MSGLEFDLPPCYTAADKRQGCNCSRCVVLRWRERQETNKPYKDRSPAYRRAAWVANLQGGVQVMLTQEVAKRFRDSVRCDTCGRVPNMMMEVVSASEMRCGKYAVAYWCLAKENEPWRLVHVAVSKLMMVDGGDLHAGPTHDPSATHFAGTAMS